MTIEILFRTEIKVKKRKLIRAFVSLSETHHQERYCEMAGRCRSWLMLLDQMMYDLVVLGCFCCC